MKAAVILFFLLLVTSASFTHAHILSVSGDIGAIMHINPDDDPIAGQPSEIFFEFKDRQEKFLPAACNCRLRIINSAGQSVEVPISPVSASSATTRYIFPAVGAYTLTVIGRPLPPAQFSPFELEYSIRVNRDFHSSPRPRILPFVIPIVGLGLIVFLAFIIINSQRR